MKKFIYMMILSMSMLHSANIQNNAPAEMILMDSVDDDNAWIEEELPEHGTVVHEVNQFDVYHEGDTTSIENRQIDLSQLGAGDHIKVALLVPKKVIGVYANSVANTILAYLINKKTDFVFEVFDSGTENQDALNLALQKIKHKGYRFIIAPLTQGGANIVASLEKESLIFIPTVNRDDMTTENPNIIFGGIDYKAQIDALLNYADEKIVIFGDNSRLAHKLSDTIKERRLEDVIYDKQIKNMHANISYLFRRNRKLRNASVFINMPVVKSALIATQFSRYDNNISKVLSTQVNYSPLLLTLTQYQDRKNFYIANSIGKIPFDLKDSNILLGSNMVYNWIDYATSVGLDYVFTTYYASNDDRKFSEPVYESQIFYNVAIVKAMHGSFKTIDMVQAVPTPKEEFQESSEGF